MTFIELDWKEPTIKNWQIPVNTQNRSECKQMDNIRIDRGTKHVIGLQEAKKLNNDDQFIMFVDGDDFIHQDLVKFINNTTNIDMIRVFTGLKLGIKNTYKIKETFNYICGTSNIIRFHLLSKPINFSLINKKLQSTVLNCVDEYYLKMIIGSHKWMYRHFVEKRNLKGIDIPFIAVVYNCSHNEQHSGALNKEYPNKLSEKQIKQFNIRYI